jgi:glucokinase
MNAEPDRPAESLVPPAECALGIDLGGTRVKFAWFDTGSGSLRGTDVFPTADCLDGDGVPRFACDILSRISAIERELGTSFSAIGIAAPGLVAPNRRMIVSMPGRLAGLVGLDWTALLGRADLVPVLNDGHAALMGEVWQGAAKDRRDVVLLTLGTGVGGAILSNGALLQGTSGRAGHIGHISLDPDGAADIVGTPGSLEDAIGECSIAKRTDGRFHCTKDLLAAVYSGETAAKQFWDKSIQALAAAIVSFINTLDPEIIVIGGGVAQAGDALFAPLRERVAAMEWKPVGRSVPIMPTSLGELGGTSGAAFAALSQFQENPSPPE